MLSVLELFSGIGSQKKALDNLKINNKIVATADWDIFAIISYAVIHHNNEFVNRFSIWNERFAKANKHPERKIDREIERERERERLLSTLKSKPLSRDGKNLVKTLSKFTLEQLYAIELSIDISNNLLDISQISEKELIKLKIDLITYSFPCQDLSLQGKRAGLEDGKSSSQLWNVQRILEILNKKNKLPKYLLMENVPALLGETNKTNFNKWLTFLNSLGYITNKPFLLNSKFFDLPQNRQRVFAMSILGNDYKFNIPEQKTITKKTIANFIENRFNNNKFDFEYKGWKVLDWKPKKNNSGIAKTKIDNYTTFSSEAAAFSLESICPTITASGAMNRIKIIYNPKEKKIRLLQWQELWRLMGFQNEDVKKIEKINEKYNLIPVQYLSKQAGNSIPVVLLEAIFKNAFK